MDKEIDYNHEELDEAKAEVEKLKAELRFKTDSLKKLKKSHDAQIIQIQEAISKVEKVEKDLLQEADEIIFSQKIYEDHNLNLNSRESSIKHLSAANDKLGAVGADKFDKCEDENRKLVLVSEKENERVDNLEKQDIECLSISNKNCLEIKKKLKVSRELGETVDMFQKLEEENMKVEEQLICKKQHFKHLEEVHGNQINSSMKELELEKSTLLDEISSLQSKLDSDVRISQDLQHQLHVCKQALAYEESQRKYLEIEVSNWKVRFDDVSSEYQNAKSQLDYVNSQEDKDINDLRHALRTQEAFYNESKYSSEKLQIENHELRKTVRELQEAQILEAKSAHSLSILRSNLRGLEKNYRECVSIFKARHAEWSFRTEQLTETINSYQRELETKAATIEDLKMELECSHSLTTELMLLNEEMSVMLLVLKQGTSESQLKLSNDNEPDKHREMCRESTKSQMEIYLKEQLKVVYDALDKANSELNKRACERSEMEFELQMWKSFSEHLENDLEENIVMRKALENSLLVQVDFSETLKQEKDSLEQELRVRETKASVPAVGETAVSSEDVDERYLRIIEEKEKILEKFQKEVLRLEQISFRRESESAVIAKGNVERTNELEKEDNLHFVRCINMTTDELMQQVTSLEKELINSLTPITLQLAEKQAQITQVQEVCDMITEAETLAAIEIEEKKLTIEELDDDIHDMEQKLKLQEENWSQLKQLALDIEMEMDAKQLKIKELTDQMENKLKGSDVLIQKIKMENRSLLENAATRLSPERENLLGFVMGLGDKMSDCTNADSRQIDVLRRLVQSSEKDLIGIDFKNNDGLLVKEKIVIHSSTGINKPENCSDIRSPFKEINN